MVPEVPDVEEFDKPDLLLSPQMHHAQAKMAAERGEKYDPYELEKELEERSEESPDLDEAEPLEGKEDLHREWLNAG